MRLAVRPTCVVERTSCFAFEREYDGKTVRGAHRWNESRNYCKMRHKWRMYSFWNSKNNANNNELAISVRGVTLDFEKNDLSRVQVLKGVDLDVPEGCFHMLLGANGCGKSTLLRILSGLLHVTSGDVIIEEPHGYVFQNPDHQVVLPTVAADVAFGLGKYSLSSEEIQATVMHSLNLVNLSAFADRPTSSLSGGQKQRVAIAGALAENPRILLLDELTTFLDGKDQKNVLECVRHIVDSGAVSAALWVTHRLEELEYADRVSFMENGKITFEGSPSQAQKLMRSKGAAI